MISLGCIESLSFSHCLLIHIGVLNFNDISFTAWRDSTIGERFSQYPYICNMTDSIRCYIWIWCIEANLLCLLLGPILPFLMPISFVIRIGTVTIGFMREMMNLNISPLGNHRMSFWTKDLPCHFICIVVNMDTSPFQWIRKIYKSHFISIEKYIQIVQNQ